MKPKTLIILIVIGAVLLVMAALLLKKGDTGTSVAVQEAKARTIIESVSASGKINPVNEVKVSPDISGEVIELYVEEGQVVTKGQLLARIDASLYTTNVARANAMLNQSKAGVSNAQSQLAQLEAQLEQARSQYKRSQDLYNDKVISAVEYEQARAAFKSAEANIKAASSSITSSKYNVESSAASLSEANQSIRRASVYAPMSGIVSKLNVKQGERVVGTAQMAGTEMLRIANMSVMKVEVEIGENDIQKININDTANIEVDAYAKRTFKGLVTKIAQSNTGSALASASTDQASNYTVSIELDPSSYADLLQNKTKFPFRPGMSATAEILTKHINGVLTVPINAVTTRDLDSNQSNETAQDRIKEYVFVVNAQNHAVLTPVTTGPQDNEYITIQQGLKAGDKVIFAPYSQVANKLKDKSLVKIVDKKLLFEKDSEE